ncbi:hypothetical protein [Marinobacter sp. MBR-105]|jgi:hypothetical protein
MSSRKEHNYEQIAQALRVNYLCLAMFDAVGKEFNVSNRMDIPKAMAQAETRLQEYWKTGAINYIDIQPVMKTAARAGHELWSPQADTFTQRASVHAVNMDARAWQHDAVIRDEPYINEPDNVVDFDEELLAAYEVVRERFDLGSPDSLARLDLKAISNALDARQTLATLQNETQRIENPALRNHGSLSGINPITATHSSVSAWLHHLAAQEALPSAKTIEPLLRSQFGDEGDGVDTNLVKRTADEWNNELNSAPEGWAEQSINSLVDILVTDKLRDNYRSSVEALTDILSEAAAQKGYRAAEFNTLRNEISTHRHLKAEMETARKAGADINSAIELLRTAIQSASAVRFGRSFETNSKAERQMASELDLVKEQLIKKLENLPESFDELITDIVDAGITPEEQHQGWAGELKFG